MTCIGIDQKYLNEAMKEGSITCSITKVVVQGEARVGKTSLKCALTNDEYKKESTAVIEPSVAVSCYSQDRNSVQFCQYKLISAKEMRAKVRNAIQSKAKNEAATDKAVTDKGATDKAARNKVATDHVTTIGTSNQPQVLSQEEKEATTTTSEATTLINEVNSVSANKTREMQNAIALVEQFRDDCKKAQEEGKTLDGERWLYFIDTGGQIQFQKLLPVFMPFASVLIVVVSLAKSLTEPSSAVAHYDGEDMTTGSETLSVEEVLKQLFSSIIPSTFRYMNDPNLPEHINFKKQPSGSLPNKPSRINIIPVATCGDKCIDVSVTCRLNKMQEKLNSILKCHKEKCKCMPESSIIDILEVDGRIADREKKLSEDRKSFTEKSLETITQVLGDNEYEFTVPINWYCLDVLLHEKARDGCGILTLSFCQKIGRALGMSLPQISSALKFLHLFNKILYYHNSEACSDLVFVEVNSLVNILKKLVMLIYKSQPNVKTLNPDLDALVREGKLTIEIMINVLNGKYDKKGGKEAHKDYQPLRSQCKNSQFEEKLLKLFQELLIAAPLSPNEYFVPALLPLKIDTHVPPYHFPSFLFHFEDAVPMGFFCAVIVHLLSHSPVEWIFIGEKNNFSNYFVLECTTDYYFEITLVEQVNHIELRCDDQKYQGIARESVKEAIESAASKHNLSINYDKRFHCSCDTSKLEKHFAIAKPGNVIKCSKPDNGQVINDLNLTHWLTCKF